MTLRILVVEDDAVIGILLGEMLEAMGHEVCAIASTEVEAVAAATLHRPGLMIVDAQLGEGSGIRAVEQILLSGPMPYLFTSGDTLRARKLKPDAVMIQKPFQEPELTRAIERALGRDERTMLD
jgi:CheY-like chemotaxis protein